MQWLKRIMEKGRNGAEQGACQSRPPKLAQLRGGGFVYSSTKVMPVSAADLSKNKVILDEQSRIAEQFKLLRTRIFSRTRPEGWSTIQITGFDPGEGKTLIATNLAISIAMDSRQTTLLVDLDFRNPSIHAIFGLAPETPGLASYFVGEKKLEEILINPGIDGLTVLPAGGRILQAPELMGSPAMEVLVRELKERYKDRYIIFDTPPMNSFPDALVFSEYVDSIILVARAGHTTKTSVENTVDLLPHQKVLGLIFNSVTTRDQKDEYKP